MTTQARTETRELVREHYGQIAKTDGSCGCGTIGSQTVVYVSDPQQLGRYLERSVALGSAAGDKVEVASGLTEGDQVVIAGSFTRRAERDRLGLPAPATVAAPVRPPVAQTTPVVRKIEIQVTKDGFVPTSIDVEAGAPVELVFISRTDETCAKEIVVPSVKARKPLPLNQRVSISLPSSPPGTLTFVCGMNMLKGTIVVR